MMKTGGQSPQLGIAEESFAPSRGMKSIVSRGNEIDRHGDEPARMMLKSSRQSRLAERIATRSPRASLCAEKCAPTPVAAFPLPVR
jgi:hypothetical protein